MVLCCAYLLIISVGQLLDVQVTVDISGLVLEFLRNSIFPRLKCPDQPADRLVVKYALKNDFPLLHVYF